MGYFFPLSKHRSPLSSVLFTFFGPVIFGAVSGAVVYFVFRHYIGDVLWSRGMGAFVLVGMIYVDFQRIRFCFEAESEFTLAEVLARPVLLAIYWSIVCVAGFEAFPWLQARLPEWSTALGYPDYAQGLKDHAVVPAVGLSLLTALFLQVVMSYYSGRREVRGEKVGTIKSIKQMLAKRRKRRDSRREDDILKRIHRDGGTDKIPKADLDFLKSRSRMPRWQRT